jgi:hypothetical protein
MKMTLAVFGEAIFGSAMDVFSDDAKSKDNFCSRLMFTNGNLHIALIVPQIMKRWPFTKFEEVDKAFGIMEKQMTEMLDSARSDEIGQRKDLLSLLSRRCLCVCLFCFFFFFFFIATSGQNHSQTRKQWPMCGCSLSQVRSKKKKKSSFYFEQPNRNGDECAYVGMDAVASRFSS